MENSALVVLISVLGFLVKLYGAYLQRQQDEKLTKVVAKLDELEKKTKYLN